MRGVPLTPELVEFRPDSPEAIVARMDELASTGKGWITLQPGFDEDDVPPSTPGLLSLFGGSGPPVPECTWTPTEIGIRHGAGPKVVARLRENGVAVPDGWRVLQDHPKRGLVLAVPPDAPRAAVLRWLLDVAVLLTRVRLTGDWRAAIYVTR